jgi:hypothetical protein
MAGEWARLTGPKGDRATPYVVHAMPVIQVLVLLTNGGSQLIQYDTSWTVPRVVRTWDNMCFMEGLIRRTDSATIAGGIICNLPAGFRPEARTLLNSVASADGINCFARVDVDPNGDVTYQASMAASGWISPAGRWYAVQ